jgi:stage II sporulation protein AA (anti-sigma F factor antagonist)
VDEAAPDGLTIEVSWPSEDVLLIVLDGALDTVSSGSFSARMEEIAWGAPPHVVMDIAGLTSVDSSGIDALVQAARALEALGRTAVLAAPSPEALRAFEIAQLTQVVSVVEDRESALAQYAPDDDPEALADDGW